MLRYLILISIIACQAWSEEVDIIDKKPDGIIRGCWSLTEEWSGYMGVTIRFFENGTFNYWFYSDVKLGDEPKYPVQGKWYFEKGKLFLTSEHSLYENKWHVLKYRGHLCLWPDRNVQRWKKKLKGEPDFSRILFQSLKFDPKYPFDYVQSYKDIKPKKIEGKKK